MKSYSAQEISTLIKGNMVGDTSHTVSSPEQIELAGSNQITFIGNKKYEKLWPVLRHR